MKRVKGVSLVVLFIVFLSSISLGTMFLRQANAAVAQNIVNVVSTKRFEPYNANEFNFKITLDKKIGSGNTEYMRAVNNTDPATDNYIEESFANEITINGVKIKEHDVPNVRRSSFRLLEENDKTVIELGISGHADGYTDPFKLDGTDKLVISKNFKTYVGTSNGSNYTEAYSFDRDIEITYNNLANRWATYGGECEITNFAQHNSTSNLFNIYFGDKEVYGNANTGEEKDGDMFRAIFNNGQAGVNEYISEGLRDFVFVNGKSLKEYDVSGIRRSGLQYCKRADGVTFATLEVCGESGDLANPLDFSKKNTITFKQGFKTDPNPHTSLYWDLKEDVTFDYNPFTQQWGVCRGDFNITSLKMTNKVGGDYNFDLSFNKELYNSGTADGFGNSAYYYSGNYVGESMDNSKLSDGLANFVEINGKLLKEYDVLVDGTGNPLQRSYIQYKKSADKGNYADFKIPGAGHNILKLDGTDTITFKKGFSSSPNLTSEGAQSYYTLEKDTTFVYNPTTDMWIMDNEIRITGVRRRVEADGVFSIYQVVFDKQIFPTIDGQFNEGDTIFSTQTEADSLEVRVLRNYIRINGILVKDIPNLIIDGQPAAAAFIRFRGLNNGESVVEIGIRNDMADKDDVIKMDGTDTFEILSGFHTMYPYSGSTKTDSSKYVYIPNYDYLINIEGNAEIYEPSEIKIIGIENGATDDVWYNLHVKFDKNPSLQGIGGIQDEKFKEVFGNKIKFNGKTIEELRALSTVEKSLVSAHFVEMGDTKQFYLSLYVRKEAVDKPEMDINNPLEIEFLEGLRSYCYDELLTSKTFIYNATYGIGVEKLAEEPTYEEVKITNISGIIPEFHEGNELNRKLVINFDKDVTQRFLPHINADPSWIMGTPIGANYGYSYSELGKYAVYGVLGSIRDKITINGKSLGQLMGNNEDKMTGIKAHYGGSGNLASLELWFSTDQKSALDYGTDYTIIFKEGFITPMGGKISADTKYVYSTTENKCYLNELPKPDDSTNSSNNSTSGNDNWNKSNTSLILKIVIPVGVAILAGVVVLVIILKKKKRS